MERMCLVTHQFEIFANKTYKCIHGYGAFIISGMNNKFPALKIETSAAFGTDDSSNECASVCAPVVSSF